MLSKSCTVILLIWYLYSLLLSLSLSLSDRLSVCLSVLPLAQPHARSFPVPSATRGYWLHNSGPANACVCVRLCGCPRAWEIKHGTCSFQVLLAFRLIDSVNTDCLGGTSSCVCVCVCVCFCVCVCVCEHNSVDPVAVCLNSTRWTQRACNTNLVH